MIGVGCNERPQSASLANFGIDALSPYEFGALILVVGSGISSGGCLRSDLGGHLRKGFGAVCKVITDS